MEIRNIAIIAQVDVASRHATTRSLTPCGFSASTTGKLPFSRPLSRLRALGSRDNVDTF